MAQGSGGTVTVVAPLQPVGQATRRRPFAARFLLR